MSCFLMQDDTIRGLASKIASELMKPDCGDLQRCNGFEEWDKTDDSVKIADQLYALNREAYRQRYGAVSDYMPDFSKVQPCHAIHTNFFAFAKALDCWLYQCAEGDVPDKPLYKMLRAWARLLRDRCVKNLPEYLAADTWR